MRKNLTLRAKLILGFASVLAFLVVLGVLSVTRFTAVQRDISVMVSETENQLLSVTREVDHLTWLQELSSLFLDEEVRQVIVETDHQLCGLGRWMYGGELEQLAAASPELASLVRGLQEPHEELHESAQAIDRAYQWYDAKGYDQLVLGWVAHLEWVMGLQAAVYEGEEFEGSLDHRTCDFGLWYGSYQASDPGFAALLSGWEQPHEELHAEAAEIMQALNTGNTVLARQLFVSKVLASIEDLGEIRAETMEYLDARKSAQEEALAIFQTLTIPALTRTQHALADVVDYFQAKAQAAVNRSEAAISLVITLIAVIAAAAILTGAVLAYLTTVSILRQLGTDPALLQNLAEQVSLGNLHMSFDGKNNDSIRGVYRSVRDMVLKLREKADVLEEIGGGNFAVDVHMASENDVLGASMLQMKQSMSSLIREIQIAASQVSSSADQIAQASQSLSQGATEQAASLEEISSSLTQINAQTQQSSRNSTEANRLAMKSAEDARIGNRSMEDLVRSMEDITKASMEIQRIVKIIDDIAFQTNLLALNANVEAARSGKYGKGFAVVADEVRNLANRSATAVKETNTMVKNALDIIGQGNELTKSTAVQLGNILEGSEQVSSLVQEIAQAGLEQAGAMKQITQGLEQIEQVTQANTASAEQSSAAAEELSGQARLLEEMLRRFQIQAAGRIGFGPDAGDDKPQRYLPPPRR